MSIKPHHVRAIGCTLVSVGFLWLLGIQFLIHPISEAVMVRRRAAVDQDKQFSAEEVRSQVFLATHDVADRIPQIIVPSVLMLMGAIMLDTSSRRAANSN